MSFPLLAPPNYFPDPAPGYFWKQHEGIFCTEPDEGVILDRDGNIWQLIPYYTADDIEEMLEIDHEFETLEDLLSAITASGLTIDEFGIDGLKLQLQIDFLNYRNNINAMKESHKKLERMKRSRDWHARNNTWHKTKTE